MAAEGRWLGLSAAAPPLAAAGAQAECPGPSLVPQRLLWGMEIFSHPFY